MKFYKKYSYYYISGKIPKNNHYLFVNNVLINIKYTYKTKTYQVKSDDLIFKD